MLRLAVEAHGTPEIINSDKFVLYDKKEKIKDI